MGLLIKSIKGRRTQDIYDGTKSKAAREFHPKLHQKARDLLDAINAVTSPADLKVPPSNRLHQLRDDLAGYWSVSINDQYRIIFRWVEGHAENVEITDYH